jgi:hypothetical protein
MNYSDDKFKATFNLTTNNQTFRMNIPIDITPTTNFLVTTILGKTTGSNTDLPIFIHSPELSSQSIYESSTNGNTLLSSCVLTNVATKPITGYVTKDAIGYKCPIGLEYSPNLSLQLMDENGNLIDDSKIDFVNIGIEFYNRGNVN